MVVPMPSDFFSECIVTTTWLRDHLKHPRLVLLDASMRPLTAATTPAESRRIAGTRRFDFDKQICDLKSELPHMLPSPDFFAEKVRALGINKDSVIVIYDDIGLYASPRAWWMFKTMGHDNVVVLDGGLPAWIAEQLPLVSECAANPLTGGNFVAVFRPELVVNCDQVAAALDNPLIEVVDARSAGRFFGTEPEPRAGLRGGHMPNALNLPFPEVLNGGHLRSPVELAAKFHAVCGKRQQLIFTCGSGVTASVLMLAATHAGYKKLSVYDGSWSEWGLPSTRKVLGNGDR